MNYPEINMALIAKYMCRETDTAESEEVEKWIAGSDSNREEFERLKEVWDRASAYSGFERWNTERRKTEFLRKIIENERTLRLLNADRGNRMHRIIRETMKYAAALATVAVLVFFISRYLDREPGVAGTTEVSAARGSKTGMLLADGSRVVLNAGSTLKYEGSYNNKGRDVYLEGEGYFEVRGDASRPFRVHAGNIVVEALGTVFNVKAYPDEDLIETTLVEGKVSVESEASPESKVWLSPDEQANYYKPGSNRRMSDSFLIIRGVNSGQNISWINDQLIITNESLGSLAVKLGRKYDVDFNFADSSLAKLRYTGTLNNETIEQVLDILKISSPLDYRIEKRDIWLFPEHK